MNFVRVSDSVCNRWRGLGCVVKVTGRHGNGQVAALPSLYPKGSQWSSKFPNGPSNHLVQCHVALYLDSARWLHPTLVPPCSTPSLLMPMWRSQRPVHHTPNPNHHLETLTLPTDGHSSSLLGPRLLSSLTLPNSQTGLHAPASRDFIVSSHPFPVTPLSLPTLLSTSCSPPPVNPPKPTSGATFLTSQKWSGHSRKCVQVTLNHALSYTIDRTIDDLLVWL